MLEIVKGRKISKKEWVKNVMRAVEGIVRMRLKGRTLDIRMSMSNWSKKVGMEIRFQGVKEKLWRKETEYEPYFQKH